MSHQYRVTVLYREPTYARRRGGVEHPYRGSFVVSANSPEGAIREARLEFKRWAKMSQVNWPREIVELHCELLDAPSAEKD